MNVTLRQLAILVKVVDVQSITKAAEELYLSQPAVSIQLKKLQQQFEVPLTELVGRQLYVTDFGREVAESARRILAEMEQISYKAQSHRGQLAGRLHISIVSTAKYVMPYFLAKFMKLHPAVDLKMDVTNKRQVVRSLEENEVDFSLVSVIPKQLKLERIELLENQLQLVARTGTFTNKQPTLADVVSKHPLLFREPGSATRDAMEHYLQGQEHPMVKRIELTSNEALKQAIVAGLGVSVMPLIGLRNQLVADELEIIKLPGLPIITYWNLVWLSSKQLSPVATAYLEFVQEQKQAIVEEDFGWVNNYSSTTT